MKRLETPIELTEQVTEDEEEFNLEQLEAIFRHLPSSIEFDEAVKLKWKEIGHFKLR